MSAPYENVRDWRGPIAIPPASLRILRHFKIRLRPVHPDLQEAIDFHHAIIAEGSKALVGYDTAKALANVVLLSEIPTTYDKERTATGERRQPVVARGARGWKNLFWGDSRRD